MLAQAFCVTRLHGSGRSLCSRLELSTRITRVIERHLSVSACLNSNANASTKAKLNRETEASTDVGVDVETITSNPKLQARLKPVIAKNPERLEWKPIYRFKYITVARMAQRAKIGQTVLTCCVVLPMCVTTYLAGYSELETVTGALTISTLAMIMLNVVGNLSSRIVGAVYFPKDPKRKDELIMSTLSFWGNRVDTVMPRNSFVYLSDMDEADVESDAFIKLRYVDVAERQDPRYLSLRFGTIEDLGEFESVFGAVAQLRPKGRPER